MVNEWVNTGDSDFEEDDSEYDFGDPTDGLQDPSDPGSVVNDVSDDDDDGSPNDDYDWDNTVTESDWNPAMNHPSQDNETDEVDLNRWVNTIDDMTFASDDDSTAPGGLSWPLLGAVIVGGLALGYVGSR